MLKKWKQIFIIIVLVVAAKKNQAAENDTIYVNGEQPPSIELLEFLGEWQDESEQNIEPGKMNELLIKELSESNNDMEGSTVPALNNDKSSNMNQNNMNLNRKSEENNNDK